MELKKGVTPKKMKNDFLLFFCKGFQALPTGEKKNRVIPIFHLKNLAKNLKSPNSNINNILKGVQLYYEY